MRSKFDHIRIEKLNLQVERKFVEGREWTALSSALSS